MSVSRAPAGVPRLRLRPRLFTRPGPVLAALILAINDHLLKGSGLLPDWLTGKLSDFAGLFFFPLFVAELGLLVFPAASARQVQRRVVVAAALTGAGFCAIKLSPAMSGLYERGLGAVMGPAGMRVANTPDPTDLVALPMLALAVWSAHRTGAPFTPAALSQAGGGAPR